MSRRFNILRLWIAYDRGRGYRSTNVVQQGEVQWVLLYVALVSSTLRWMFPPGILPLRASTSWRLGSLQVSRVIVSMPAMPSLCPVLLMFTLTEVEALTSIRRTPRKSGIMAVGSLLLG